MMLFSVSMATAIAQDNHDYLIERYNSLHNSKMQEKFKMIHPMPAGVVYVQHPGEGEKEMRAHFRLMKELGFNSLKQILVVPGWEVEDVQLIALEEGLVPMWYGDAAWEPVTPELLKKLGIPENSDINTIRNHPAMTAYQNSLLKERILKSKENNITPDNRRRSRSQQTPVQSVGGRGEELTGYGEEQFVIWLKKHYGTIENLNYAWNLHHTDLGQPFDSWEEFRDRWKATSRRNFKTVIDILSFKAENRCERILEGSVAFSQADRNVPTRQGGEMGLFIPAAYMGINMEKIADVVREYGSFYPSTHLAWHFNETNNEVVRPFYIQASLMNDYFKGGWTGGWESTGGPQQFDGAKNSSKLNSYYVDGGTLMQIYMSQMASGFKGFGIWCWSARWAGKEGGEYSLLDRNNQPTDRAVRLGMMAKAMQKYRDEIWEAHKEPLVGILVDWNNDAAWAAMSVTGRDDFRMFPIESRIGASRALMNENIPFEFITPDDLKNGLANRYKVIYLPAIIALDQEVFKILDSFVSNGGRLVFDMPTGKFDENTEIMPTGRDSRFNRIFGATLDNFQFSGSNVTVSLKGKEWTGLIADLTPTSGQILDCYSTGKPAIIENKYGKGSAVIIGLDVSHQCFGPGNQLAEMILTENTLGDLKPPYSCEEALVYRLSSPAADHYFFISDGEARQVAFRSSYKYRNATDAITGEQVDTGSISLKANDARWIRMEK